MDVPCLVSLQSNSGCNCLWVNIKLVWMGGWPPEVASRALHSSSLCCAFPPSTLRHDPSQQPLEGVLLSPFHRSAHQVLGRLNISLQVMQSGSGHARTGTVSCVEEGFASTTFCCLEQCRLCATAHGAREGGICWGAIHCGGLQHANEADSQTGCRMGQ